jgi:MoaA/NifB/PqqE/SkfB family radical SAM enzyme
MVKSMSGNFLEIELTGQCNYRCKHCYGGFPREGELPTDKVKEIIDRIPTNYGIIFSGGEPFLREELEELVDYAKDFIVWITTNGHLVYKDRLDRMRETAIPVFGLDGIGAIHDEYRGCKGSYEKVVEALRTAENRPKEIITTLWKGMLDQIDELIEIGTKYKAIVHFNDLIPVGRSRNHPEIFLTPGEKDGVNEKLYRIRNERVLTDLYKVTERDLKEGINLFCKGRFNVTPTGDVRPCEFHHKSFGNVFEEEFEKILSRARESHFYQARENGFKEYACSDLKDPFDYHTSICHKIPL